MPAEADPAGQMKNGEAAKQQVLWAPKNWTRFFYCAGKWDLAKKRVAPFERLVRAVAGVVMALLAISKAPPWLFLGSGTLILLRGC